MIRINFRKSPRGKIARHRQKVSMTTGTWLLSAAVFLIIAMLVLFLVRSFFGPPIHEQEIGRGPTTNSFSCLFP